MLLQVELHWDWQAVADTATYAASNRVISNVEPFDAVTDSRTGRDAITTMSEWSVLADFERLIRTEQDAANDCKLNEASKG